MTPMNGQRPKGAGGGGQNRIEDAAILLMRFATLVLVGYLAATW